LWIVSINALFYTQIKSPGAEPGRGERKHRCRYLARSPCPCLWNSPRLSSSPIDANSHRNHCLTKVIAIESVVAYVIISSKTIDGTPSVNEIRYGSSIILVTTVKLNSNEDPGYPAGPIIGFEYWDYDAFNKDDLLLSEQRFQVPIGKLLWSHEAHAALYVKR